MKILNTKHGAATIRPPLRKDIRELEATTGWRLVPDNMLMSEIMFTAMLDLECENDMDFFACVDGLYTKEGQE